MIYDFHVHTRCSDGKYSKIELLNYFNRKNYDVVAFADHNYVELLSNDTIDEEYFANYGTRQRVEMIDAVEFDVDENSMLHILGYDIRDKVLIKEKLDLVKKINSDITREIINKIRKIYGIEIPVEDLIHASVDGNITKSSITSWMVSHGYAKDYLEAGYLYTSKYSPCYEKRYSLKMVEVLQLINDGFGLSVLAHPSTIGCSDTALWKLLVNLVDNGLNGIEVNNLDKTTSEQLVFYKMIASKLNLLQTSGSDFHSETTTKRLGLVDDDSKEFINILKRRKKNEI